LYQFVVALEVILEVALDVVQVAKVGADVGQQNSGKNQNF
jgi:hypothetical protein